MTGAQLTQLRYGFAMGSATRLANRVGVHPSTIRRNERRAWVTTYTRETIYRHPLARAFFHGLMTAKHEQRRES